MSMSFPVKRYESYDFFVFFTDIVGVVVFFNRKIRTLVAHINNPDKCMENIKPVCFLQISVHFL